jgi:predicted MPP superfamily phosphohydrolase
LAATIRGLREYNYDLRILLAHRTATAYQAAKFGFDLQLSGHTHGGQFFPWNYIIHWVQPFAAGLYRHQDMWIYCSRGTGFWGPPMRLGAPAEITVINLHPRKSHPNQKQGDARTDLGNTPPELRTDFEL